MFLLGGKIIFWLKTRLWELVFSSCICSCLCSCLFYPWSFCTNFYCFLLVLTVCCLTKLPNPICDDVLLLATFPHALFLSASPTTAVPWGVPAQCVPVPDPGCLCACQHLSGQECQPSYAVPRSSSAVSRHPWDDRAPAPRQCDTAAALVRQQDPAFCASDSPCIQYQKRS